MFIWVSSKTKNKKQKKKKLSGIHLFVPFEAGCSIEVGVRRHVAVTCKHTLLRVGPLYSRESPFVQLYPGLGRGSESFYPVKN